MSALRSKVSGDFFDEVIAELRATYNEREKRIDVFRREKRIISEVMDETGDEWTGCDLEDISLDFNLCNPRHSDGDDEPDEWNLIVYPVEDGHVDTSREGDVHLTVIRRTITMN